jgi:hypothetical protein
VTNRHDLKGKTRLAACGAGRWCDLECLSRHETESTRDFFKLKRGDVFALADAPTQGGGRLRPDQRVTRWAPRGNLIPP